MGSALVGEREVLDDGVWLSLWGIHMRGDICVAVEAHVAVVGNRCVNVHTSVRGHATEADEVDVGDFALVLAGVRDHSIKGILPYSKSSFQVRKK